VNAHPLEDLAGQMAFAGGGRLNPDIEGALWERLPAAL
jgi:hypothetical protein